jgi:ATP-dependent DNA ligase
MKRSASSRRMNLSMASPSGLAQRSSTDTLYAALCERGLESVVAKKLNGRYRPRSRYWIKRKTLATGQNEEREAVSRSTSLERRLPTSLNAANGVRNDARALAV